VGVSGSVEQGLIDKAESFITWGRGLSEQADQSAEEKKREKKRQDGRQTETETEKRRTSPAHPPLQPEERQCAREEREREREIKRRDAQQQPTRIAGRHHFLLLGSSSSSSSSSSKRNIYLLPARNRTTSSSRRRRRQERERGAVSAARGSQEATNQPTRERVRSRRPDGWGWETDPTRKQQTRKEEPRFRLYLTNGINGRKKEKRRKTRCLSLSRVCLFHSFSQRSEAGRAPSIP